MNAVVTEIPPPIFLMGHTRSGGTLLSSILDSHSRIAVYHESYYYTFFRPDLHRYGGLSRLPNLLRLIADLREVIRIQKCMRPPEVKEFLEALVAPTFEGILTTLLHLYTQQQGKVRGGDKTPGHYRYLAEILERFPHSPVIFYIRDPRDTVLASREAFGTSLNAAAWSWNQAVESYRNSSRPVHLVRYEELVRKPEEVIKKICAFLGEKYEPQMLRFYERIPGFLAARPHHKHLLEPVNPGYVGIFRQMSQRDIEWIESVCAAGMEALGYDFIGAKPKAPPITPATKFEFVMDRLRYYQWYWGRWRRGWIRWKIVLRVRLRYLLSLGWLREKR